MQRASVEDVACCVPATRIHRTYIEPTARLPPTCIDPTVRVHPAIVDAAARIEVTRIHPHPVTAPIDPS
jgi:hypothetical protein